MLLLKRSWLATTSLVAPNSADTAESSEDTRIVVTRVASGEGAG